MRLGVNIDHIATLPEARREFLAHPIGAAREVMAGGSDGIVCHLREDRRHIRDKDVFELRRLKTRLDLEMAATAEMFAIALKLKPEMVTIVPEKREEITTEGGLNIRSEIRNPGSEIKKNIQRLQKSNILVSLFIDPEEKQIRASAESGVEFIELHTGKYAASDHRAARPALQKIKQAVKLAKSLGLRVNAGHGLDYNNVGNIVKIAGIEELNIGFSIIARSVFVGLKKAVQEMRELIHGGMKL